MTEVLPEFLRGLDDAFFYLIALSESKTWLVAMDFATASTAHQCRIIEANVLNTVCVGSTESDLCRGIQFDDIRFERNEIILSRNEDDPNDAIVLRLKVDGNNIGRYANAYLPGLDDAKSIESALKILHDSNHLKWKSISV